MNTEKITKLTILEELIADTNLDEGDCFTLTEIIQLSKDKGFCFAGNGYLSRKCKPRQIQNRISKLEKLG